MSLETKINARLNKINIFDFSKKYLILTGLLIVVGTGLAFAMGFKDNSFRYKMTVEVETPEGIKIGSAVREITVDIAHPDIQGLNDTRAFVKGEAVVVDLGKRGLLFALMGTDEYRTVFDNFQNTPPGMTEEGIKYFQGLVKQRAKVNPKIIFPRIVNFKNIKDPKTVELVNRHNLSITYGNGVTLKEVVIELTDEPVTQEINKWLPWLENIKMSYLSGEHLNGTELYQQLHGGHFKSEGK